jgi:hypothetical protein
MPFGRARVRHRLDDLVLNGQQRRAPLGLAAHRLEGIQPNMARIVRRLRRSDGIVRRIGYPNTLGNGGTWHCKGPQRAGINDRFAKTGKIIGPR